jgi:predicted O-methyltransferase YrrM
MEGLKMKKWLLLGLLTIITVSLNGYDLEWDPYKQKALDYQDDKYIRGWCNPEKAEKMMDLIFDTHPKICVEIGVFGGSSIYPTACALKYLNEGKVHAIDPWSNEECTKGYSPTDPNYIWWNKVPQEEIYRGFKDMLHRYKLVPFCTILRMTSQQAVDQFQDETIDILHIDGNHTELVALKDVQLFLPKVKKGGYIWFDDTNWSSTKRAIMHLAEHCSFDETRSTKTCFLFQKN